MNAGIHLKIYLTIISEFHLFVYVLNNGFEQFYRRGNFKMKRQIRFFARIPVRSGFCFLKGFVKRNSLPQMDKPLFDLSGSPSPQSRPFDQTGNIVLPFKGENTKRTGLIIHAGFFAVTVNGIFQHDCHVAQLPLQNRGVHPLHGQHIVPLLAFDVAEQPDHAQNTQNNQQDGQNVCPVNIATVLPGCTDTGGKHRKRHKKNELLKSHVGSWMKNIRKNVEYEVNKKNPCC